MTDTTAWAISRLSNERLEDNIARAYQEDTKDRKTHFGRTRVGSEKVLRGSATLALLWGEWDARVEAGVIDLED